MGRAGRRGRAAPPGGGVSCSHGRGELQGSPACSLWHLSVRRHGPSVHEEGSMAPVAAACSMSPGPFPGPHSCPSSGPGTSSVATVLPQLLVAQIPGAARRWQLGLRDWGPANARQRGTSERPGAPRPEGRGGREGALPGACCLRGLSLCEKAKTEQGVNCPTLYKNGSMYSF